MKKVLLFVIVLSMIFTIIPSVVFATGVVESVKMTSNVSRGIGTYEVYLEDSQGIREPFVAEIWEYALNGSYNEGYSLDTTTYFDELRVGDYEGYDIVKFVFTAFDGEAFTEEDVAAAGFADDLLFEYSSYTMGEGGIWWYNSDENKSYEQNIGLDDGKLVVAFQEIPNEDYYLSIDSGTDNGCHLSVYGTLQVGGKSQYISTTILSKETGEIKATDYIDVTAQSRREVMQYINEGKKYRIIYSGEDIVITDEVFIPKNIMLYAEQNNITVADGGVLTIASDGQIGAFVACNNFKIENGGTLKTDDWSNSGVYYYSRLGVVSDIVVEQGGTIINDGALRLTTNISDTEDSDLIIDGNLNIDYGLIIEIGGFNNVILNGEIIAMTSLRIADCNNVTINGNMQLDSSSVDIYSNVNITENANIVLDGYIQDLTSMPGWENTGLPEFMIIDSDLNIHGNCINNGKITLDVSSVTFDNPGGEIINNGSIIIGENSNVVAAGANLINNGDVSGVGELNIAVGEKVSDYDTGIQYAEEENDEALDSYSRYKFTHTPDKIVNVTLYKGNIINGDEGACGQTVTIKNEQLPIVEEKSITKTTYEKLTALNKYKFTITAEEVLSEKIYVAAYSEGGRLLSIVEAAFDGDVETAASIPVLAEISYVKIFVWDQQLKPTAVPEKVEITE